MTSSASQSQACVRALAYTPTPTQPLLHQRPKMGQKAAAKHNESNKEENRTDRRTTLPWKQQFAV